MNRNRETIQAQTWYMPIVDGIRSRIVTIIVTAIIAVIGTVFAFSPQLYSLTNKVAAIEANYITKEDFRGFENAQNDKWKYLFIGLGLPQPVSP